MAQCIRPVASRYWEYKAATSSRLTDDASLVCTEHDISKPQDEWAELHF